MVTTSRVGIVAASLLLGARACSNFFMNNDYAISVRTMDLGSETLKWEFATRPQGAGPLRNATYGYLAVVPQVSVITDDALVVAGMNSAGLSCDLQTLLGSQHPERNASLDNIDAASICQWALEGYGSVEEISAALPTVNFVESKIVTNSHWVFRDAVGQSLALEFLAGRAQITIDNNDAGTTGFGIFTNEPEFTWHLEAVRHLEWKMGLARSSVAMPGSWYPDERFQRIHLVKSGMPQPKHYQEAVVQAVHVLNTITVPMGEQIGTDSGKGEGLGDHTQFGIIYDHKQRVVYWRTEVNQNFQRIRFEDIALEIGASERTLQLESPKLPWFSDAASQLSSKVAV